MLHNKWLIKEAKKDLKGGKCSQISHGIDGTEARTDKCWLYQHAC
jgi:hypothetical protein